LKKSHLKYLAIFLILFFAYYLNFLFLSNERNIFRNQNHIKYLIPSQISGPLSMEFKNILCDFLFLKLITFTGKQLRNNKKIHDINYIISLTNIITNLDPLFWDPYFFSCMMIAWNCDKYNLALKILKKAEKNLENDYRPYYFAGFIYYYFLKNQEKAGEYMVKACKLPGSPEYLPFFAAKLLTSSLKHKQAAVFLKYMIKNTVNKNIARKFEKKLKSVNELILLENAGEFYFDKLNNRSTISITHIVS